MEYIDLKRGWLCAFKKCQLLKDNKLVRVQQIENVYLSALCLYLETWILLGWEREWGKTIFEDIKLQTAGMDSPISWESESSS